MVRSAKRTTEEANSKVDLFYEYDLKSEIVRERHYKKNGFILVNLPKLVNLATHPMKKERFGSRKVMFTVNLPIIFVKKVSKIKCHKNSDL